jgi:polysaccharide biosynthesis/export protein
VKGRAALIAGAALVVAAAAFAQGTPPPAGENPVAPTTGTQGVRPTVESGQPVPGLGESLREGYMPREAGIAPLAGPVDAATYRVGPGDVLQLQLWGRVSRNLLLEVGPEGVMLLPGAGTLRVHGLTLAQVRAEVLERMRAEFRGVNMDLRLARPRTYRIYLTGQVRNPGPREASGSHRVADVLEPGQLFETSSLRNITLEHRDGERETADLDLFFRTGDATLNPWLRDGDVIQVPVATDFVHAQGAVARPGRIELGPRDSLLTLLRLAGEPTPSADAERALLIRWKKPFEPESLWFRLDEVYSRAVNPPLREGERLYVYHVPLYHLQLEATIQGEVARPGVYPIREGQTRLSDLVGAAGGFLPGADLSAIRVHRRHPGAQEQDPEQDRLLRLSRSQLTNSEYEAMRTKLAGQREDYRVDWNRLLRNGSELDLLLRDGDIVRVERLVSSIRVDGEVRRPGILSFRRGQGVADYVRQAGGFNDRAWASRVRVTRSVTGQTLLARNVSTLDPGDLIWVPERPDRTLWDSTRDVLTAVAQVATVVIAIRSVR